MQSGQPAGAAAALSAAALSARTATPVPLARLALVQGELARVAPFEPRRPPLSARSPGVVSFCFLTSGLFTVAYVRNALIFVFELA